MREEIAHQRFGRAAIPHAIVRRRGQEAHQQMDEHGMSRVLLHRLRETIARRPVALEGSQRQDRSEGRLDAACVEPLDLLVLCDRVGRAAGSA